MPKKYMSQSVINMSIQSTWNPREYEIPMTHVMPNAIATWTNHDICAFTERSVDR